MVSLIGDLNLLEREFVAQNEDWIRIRMAVLVSKKMEFDGNKVLNENGSKDEKMSVIMARLENVIENFEGF
jgi:predicted transcriptional regulator